MPSILAGIALSALVSVLGPRFAAAAGAESSPVSAMSQSLEELPPIEVTSADRVLLRFQSQPDISGEYHVSPDETLSVPVIGRMSIAGMSLAQLERELTRRVTEFTGRPTYVTAEIIAYRPVYVMGFVSKPGEVEWRPGLTVLQAEALVGGLYRPPEQIGSLGEVGSVEAMRGLRTAREEQKQILASLARLRAEKTGAARIEVPAALASLAGTQQAKSLIEAQQSLLDSRRSGLEKKKTALERGSVLASNELEGLKDQAARVKEQLGMRLGLQEKLAKLLERGLVPQERSLESEIKISELEEKATGVAVARARVESTAATLRQDAVTLEEDRDAAIDAEIAKLEADLAQAGIDAEAAMQTYSRLAAEPAKNKSALLPQMTIKYTIVRRSEQGEARAPALTSSYLRPGDVLLVSQQAEERTSQPADAVEGGEGDPSGDAQ